MTPEQRFWAKVEKTEGCWLWRGAVNSSGYGHLRVNKKDVLAHRWAYEQEKGPIPEGKEPDHTCRVRRCVNNSHLELVTHKENMLRGETVAAMNARKTMCPKRHPLVGDNIKWHQGGRSRRCRICARQQCLETYRRRRERQRGV